MYYKATTIPGPGQEPRSICAMNPGVLYSTDTWSRAPKSMARQGYHLLVFASLEDLCRCAEVNYWTCLVWTARVEEPMELPRDCWNTKDLEAGKCTGVVYDWPEGTVMVRRVRLDKELPFRFIRGVKLEGVLR